ncbi:MAG: S-layer homology domain-containing protein [Clostridiales bacterium]|jgi:hypothetical protein|nr:S-layer homology domain-containing protein [Clostridiales bacterium]
MRKILASAVLLVIAIAFQPSMPIHGATDDYILNSAPASIYTGRPEAKDMISALDFSDVPGAHWAKDAITRAGALNIAKGYDKEYRPGSPASNEDVLAFILRMLNMEPQAHAAGVALESQIQDSSTLDLWTLGYLSLASQQGFITPAEFTNALIQDQAILDPSIDFVRGAPAPRERIASWLAHAFGSSYTPLGRTEQVIYSLSDWQSISPELVPVVEASLANGAMSADPSGRFNPRGSISRAELADIAKRLDKILLSTLGATKKAGTVSDFKDSQTSGTLGQGVTRDLYVRVSDGSVDVLRYTMDRPLSGQPSELDAVVLREGQVQGLGELREGDKIEYIVRDSDKKILYAQVLTPDLDMRKVYGKLKSVDTVKGTITITDANDKDYSYSMAKGMYGVDGILPWLRLDVTKVGLPELPLGRTIEISLKNYTADKARLIGEPQLADYRLGVVARNDPQLGTMTLMDQDAQLNEFRYYPKTLVVEKQRYYDPEDEVGFVDQVMPFFKFDQNDALPLDVRPGDVVCYTLDPQGYIDTLSASENYQTRFGKVMECQTYDGTASMLVEYEDGRTQAFRVPALVFRSQAGRPSGLPQNGDWVKLTVSQAIIPGQTVESAKEIEIEKGGHDISSIVTGRLAGIDPIQREIIVESSYRLQKTGWSEPRQVSRLKLDDQVQCFDESTQVSLEYLAKHKKRQGNVYLALRNSFSGERVQKISFRSGRREPLDPDVILSSNGNGTFSVAASVFPLNADEGTIVVRQGRLTDGQHILPADYAAVSLAGEGKAAVVEIRPTPNFKGVQIVRGRVLQVADNENFRVESMAVLSNDSWIYTPVRRLFSIDADTLLVDAASIRPISEFIGYTENTALGKVYNIALEGAKALRIIDAPYARTTLRGEIYKIAPDSVSLKSASYVESPTGVWKLTSSTNATATVTIPKNSLIAKNGALVGPDQLEIGDNVRVMTDKLPAIEAGLTVTGYVLLVQK